MTDAIGALRARVTLQSPTRTLDDVGGAVLGWTGQGDVWAAIEASSVGVGADFDAARGVSAYRFTINRRTDLRTGWRILWGARALRVVGVRDDGAARQTIECQEENA